MSIITLITDFGLQDSYVGAIKGVVLSVNRNAIITDIAHDVPAQDIPHGAFVLGSSFQYFPKSTVHIAVIDPGVGTHRDIILLQTPQGIFLCPDNGLLTYVLSHFLRTTHKTSVGFQDGYRLFESFKGPVPNGCTGLRLNMSKYWRNPVSDTFHGRDIFAPVAGHLSLGLPPQQFGEPVEELTYLHVPIPVETSSWMEGMIIMIDHFGNLVTNIKGKGIPLKPTSIVMSGNRIMGLSRTFEDGEGLVALVGSHGHLEIASRNGNAAEQLAAHVGDTVILEK